MRISLNLLYAVPFLVANAAGSAPMHVTAPGLWNMGQGVRQMQHAKSLLDLRRRRCCAISTRVQNVQLSLERGCFLHNGHESRTKHEAHPAQDLTVCLLHHLTAESHISSVGSNRASGGL